MVSLVFACELLEGRAYSRYSINFCRMEKWCEEQGVRVRGPIPDLLYALEQFLAFSGT